MDNSILKNKTILTIIVTIITMVAEIYFGFITNSMALTADGFHMGTHAFALFITLLVCIIALKNKDITEKLNALGGYTSAIILGLTSIGIVIESIERFFNPLSISFSEAILVAVIGLLVNLLCIMIMGDNHTHNHNHEHNNCEHTHKENLNYKAAYLHILADALTSIFAISALILGKYYNLVFLDPIIGILGGLIIAKWAIGLLTSSGKILLDKP